MREHRPKPVFLLYWRYMKPILLMQFLPTAKGRQIEVEAFLAAGNLRSNDLKIVHPLDEPMPLDLQGGIRGIIIGGGGLTVSGQTQNDEAMRAFIRAAREKNVPILGVCFGAQLLAHVFGGKVAYAPANEEIGTFNFTLSDETDRLFVGLPSSFPIQCWHHARIMRLPEGAKLLGSSERCSVQAFTFPGEKIWGVQFHPERTKAIFEKLLELRAAKMPPEAIAEIRRGLRESPEAADLVARFVEMTL